MLQRLFVPIVCVAVVAGVSAQAPDPIDAASYAQIRTEGMERSKIMWIEHYLADVYGPRPIGSPNHKAAAEWAVKTMTSWGMVNAHLEPFTWRGVGWLPGRATGFITSPVKANLKFEAVPWSPSTSGTVSGEVVSIAPPEAPTDADLTAYLAGIAPRVKGHIVMAGAPPAVAVNFNEPMKRIPDEQARARYAPGDAAAGRGRGGRGGRGRGAATPVPEGHLSPQQVNQRVAQFLRDNPPSLRLVAQGGGRIPGVIVAQNGAGQIYDDTTPQSPAVILRNDDYGRIFRIIADGTPVSVEFNVQNQFFPEGKTSYVTVGEIPGTDKADEVVMLGGHLDSWTSATGATDNAIGCAIMMEAARIIEATGLKPRRTIRVALWSGEEEGLLGSFDYVKRHFGSAESPLPDYAKIDAYWNIDDGTGLVRGASVFGPPEAAAVVAQYLKPFEPWGVYGANPVERARRGRQRQRRLRGRRPARHRRPAGPHRIQQHHVAHQSRQLRANRARRRHEECRHHRVGGVRPGQPRRDAAAFRRRPDAGDSGRVAGSGGRGNAAPLPESRVFVADKGHALSVAAPGLLPPPNPRDPDATAGASVALDGAPAHGKAAIKSDGSFVYTPEKGFVGTDTFSFTITTRGDTQAGRATIVVR